MHVHERRLGAAGPARLLGDVAPETVGDPRAEGSGGDHHLRGVLQQGRLRARITEACLARLKRGHVGAGQHLPAGKAGLLAEPEAFPLEAPGGGVAEAVHRPPGVLGGGCQDQRLRRRLRARRPEGALHKDLVVAHLNRHLDGGGVLGRALEGGAHHERVRLPWQQHARAHLRPN
eukprot:4210788-Pyramimonas_sp.AAC.1